MDTNLLTADNLALIAQGLGATVFITLATLLLGTSLGAVIYAMTLSKRRWLKKVAAGYRFIVRGMPMTILLLFIYYVFFNGRAGLTAAVIAFSVNFSNFACSLIQSSIESVGAWQVETARSLGMSARQTYHYVVAPQAIKNALPAFKFQAVSTLKGTALVGFVAVLDLAQASEAVRQSSGQAMLSYILTTIIYMLLAWLLATTLDRIGQRIGFKESPKQ